MPFDSGFMHKNISVNEFTPAVHLLISNDVFAREVCGQSRQVCHNVLYSNVSKLIMVETTVQMPGSFVF